MESAYRHFIYTTLPHHLQRKIERMAQNKGYVFRDIIFLGLQPARHPYNETVLFEKLPRENGCRYDTTLIHEYTPTTYRQTVWYHHDNTKRVVFTEQRKRFLK
jgi:hypothetical protein